MLNTYQRQAKIKLVTSIVTLVVIAGGILAIDNVKSSAGTATSSISSTGTSSPVTTTPQPTTSISTPSSQPTTSSSSSGYKDGTYSASASYYVPHGNESIQVSLTISNGTITNASIQNSEGDNESARYQEDFAAVYKSSVVGQKISGLQLSVIGGASDTTQGFNDALSQIASKAQA